MPFDPSQGFVNAVGTYRSDEPIFEGHAVEDFWGVGLRFENVPYPITRQTDYPELALGMAHDWSAGLSVGDQ